MFPMEILEFSLFECLCRACQERNRATPIAIVPFAFQNFPILRARNWLFPLCLFFFIERETRLVVYRVDNLHGKGEKRRDDFSGRRWPYVGAWARRKVVAGTPIVTRLPPAIAHNSGLLVPRPGDFPLSPSASPPSVPSPSPGRSALWQINSSRYFIG